MVTWRGAGRRDRGAEGRSRRPRGAARRAPRRGVRWLEPGEHVFPADLEAAEQAQAVRVGAGDILLVRTGHARRLAEVEPWDAAARRRGCTPRRPLPGRAPRRRARLGRQQRHRPEHHRRGGLPHSRPGAQRDGHPPLRLPAVRGPRRAMRARRGAGSSCSSPPPCASWGRDRRSIPSPSSDRSPGGRDWLTTVAAALSALFAFQPATPRSPRSPARGRLERRRLQPRPAPAASSRS